MAGELDAQDAFLLGTWLGHLKAEANLEEPEWSDIREDLQNICRYRTTEGLEFIGSEAQGLLRGCPKSPVERSSWW